MYVTNGELDSIHVIDSSTNTVVDTIAVDDGPFALEYNPSNEYIYVGHFSSNVVSVIDSATNSVVSTLNVGVGPSHLEYNPSNDDMYVTNFESGTVSVIDSSTNTVVDTIDVGESPGDLEYNPSNDDMYVSAGPYPDRLVSVIDSSTNTVVDTLDVGDNAGDSRYNPSNDDMYVPSGPNSISVIDSSTNTVVDTINVSGPSYILGYNPSNQYIYAGSPTSDCSGCIITGLVDVIDSTTNTVIDTVETSRAPREMGEYNPSNQDMFITTSTFLETGGSVYVLEDKPSFTANAGSDQTVNPGDTVQLDGSGSSNPSGGTLTYQWTQTGGPTVTLDDSTSADPIFTAPDTQVQDPIVFELVVTNEQGVRSEPDSVTITVNPSESPPSPSQIEGLLGSGNNFNFQIQENSGNNAGGQYGDGQMYSDESIFQGQSTDQDSSVVS
jgi:YVTN family beta-propeller protein